MLALFWVLVLFRVLVLWSAWFRPLVLSPVSLVLVQVLLVLVQVLLVLVQVLLVLVQVLLVLVKVLLVLVKVLLVLVQVFKVKVFKVKVFKVKVIWVGEVPEPALRSSQRLYKISGQRADQIFIQPKRRPKCYRHSPLGSIYSFSSNDGY